MKKSYKRSLFIIATLMLIAINFLFFWIGYMNFLYPKLGSFEIKGVEDKGSSLNVEITPSHNATSYRTEIYEEEQLIYETVSNNEHISLEGYIPEAEKSTRIVTTAINKNGEERKSQNEYLYENKQPAFQKNEKYFFLESDLQFPLIDYDGKTYDFELYYKENKLYETKVSQKIITIPKDILIGYSGQMLAILKNENGRILSDYKFLLNTPVVGKIKIISPSKDYSTRWDDIMIKFEGGNNATKYAVSFYKENVFEKKVSVVPKDNKFLLPAHFFDQNTDYTLVLEAMYEDYVESKELASINVHITAKETTSGVYVSHNPSFLKKGSIVSLNTETKDATIFYTIDGSDPKEKGIVYEKPFVINEDQNISTYAISKNRYDSVVSNYSFHIAEKTPVIYLSPSNQDGNYGAYNTGFTTEMAMMNKIADVVENTLKEKGFIVYRNRPYGNINSWISESRYVQADFHFAIHSNASRTGLARGPEIYVDKENSLAFSVATNIYENLWKIYEGNQTKEYHRGVKFAQGSLGEANDDFLPCSSLIEVAFHDEENDARWIANHIEEIGKNLAESIIKYYG